MSDPSPAADPLARALASIESRLGWGPASEWTTSDFNILSEQIHGATGTLLSATTLKRLWGRVAYRSQPSPTTLDALAVFLGHEHWRSYVAIQELPTEEPVLAEPAVAETASPPAKQFPWIFLMVGALLLLGLGTFFLPLSSDPPSPRNVMAHMLAAIIGYGFLENKPTVLLPGLLK